MPLTAITNAPGYHSRDAIRTDEFIEPNGNISRRDYVVTEAWCQRPKAVGGGRNGKFRLPTDYFRHVAVSLLDNPATFRYPRIGQRGFEGWDVQRRHISPHVVQLASNTWSFRTTFEEDLANAMTESNVRARNKLRDRKMQLAADLLEARKTANMIAGLASDVARAYIAAKHGRWGTIPSILGMDRKSVLSGRSVSNRWLEFQYGWKPMLGSIYDGIQLLSESSRQNMMVYGKSTRTVETERTFYDGRYECLSKAKGSATTYYAARVSDSFWDLADRFGVINPLSVAWELTPFSFVADWFIPVGNVLESLSATMGLDFVAGYQRYRREGSRRWKVTPGDIALVDPGEYVEEFFSFHRYKLNGFQLPSLYANQNPFSTSHILNAVALIRQMWR